MKELILLGSTGSIGTQTLDIVRGHREEIRVTALAAMRNTGLMEDQIREFMPSCVCMYDADAAADLKSRVSDLPVRVLSGMDGLIEIAAGEGNIVLSAVVGMIGIRPVLAAIETGKDIALANKETLVSAGHLIMPRIKESGVKLLPVDSEHSAIFQCLDHEPHHRISHIWLTCSGGTFRGKKRSELAGMKVRDALNNPNWDMGAKVTIDSASLVNKGLEVMEASWLFDVPVRKIRVVVQPQSLVHSAVAFDDGAVMAQIASPDMHLPIQYALFYPDRPPLAIPEADLSAIGSIVFEAPDTETFRGLPLAYAAAEAGGSMPTVFNAANEEAVKLFMEDRIGFLDIYDMIEGAMCAHRVTAHPSLEEILEAEKEARARVREMNHAS